MSLHYILDGYNLIKNSQFKKIKILKDARTSLIRFLISKDPLNYKKNKITVVFDGSKDFSKNTISSKDIEVVFTTDESADDWIKRAIKNSKSPQTTLIVTDDKEIVSFAKFYYIQAMGIDDFFKKIYPQEKKAKQDLIKAELSYDEIKKINEELKKLWLKK
ncbi:MAG: NYN domain-containing protein [Candidatus Omnitrophica bacterium]|nr:NYN domain-containing protein [Candidatus Omnitrophota bacterium]